MISQRSQIHQLLKTFSEMISVLWPRHTQLVHKIEADTKHELGVEKEIFWHQTIAVRLPAYHIHTMYIHICTYYKYIHTSICNLQMSFEQVRIVCTCTCTYVRQATATVCAVHIIILVAGPSLPSIFVYNIKGERAWGWGYNIRTGSPVCLIP